MTIHAECPAPIQVTSAIAGNATWGVNVANCADYVVTKMIQVQADLTIQPGTHVQFASAAGLWTTPAAAGSIHAVGTAAKPILFDGTDPTPGYWKALQFATGNPNNELTYAVVDGGGTPLTGLSGGSIVLTNSGSVKITHSVVRNGSHFGIEDVSDSEAALQGFADNRLEGNGDAPIDLPASAVGGLDTASAYDPVGTPNGKHYINVRRGIITAMDSSWAALGVPLRFTDRLEVQNAHALTIAPGSELVFTNSLAYILIQDGSTSPPRAPPPTPSCCAAATPARAPGAACASSTPRTARSTT